MVASLNQLREHVEAAASWWAAQGESEAADLLNTIAEQLGEIREPLTGWARDYDRAVFDDAMSGPRMADLETYVLHGITLDGRIRSADDLLRELARVRR